MEHPEDYKLRKRYEADRASGIAPGSMAQWMNDTAFKGLTTNTKLEAHRERIIAQVEEERRKEPHTYGDFIREIAKANSDIAKYKDVPENLQNSYRVKLNKQFDDLVDRGYFSERSRGGWISRELSNYLWSEEYKTAKDFLLYVHDTMSFPHGGIRNEKISIRCRTHRPLPDRLRGHQHRGNLERHRESGVSAGEGGAGEAWDLL